MINYGSPINFSTPCYTYSNCPLENINNNYPNFIKIYLYQPHMRIQILNIKSDRAISSLSNHYLKEMIFIFNGQILDKEKSFSFYKIPYGSKIAIFPKDVMKSDSSFQEKWIKITLDKEKFDKMIEMSVDANYRKELSRLRDMRYQKMELKKENIIFLFHQMIHMHQLQTKINKMISIIYIKKEQKSIKFNLILIMKLRKSHLISHSQLFGKK